eukprot:GHVL01017070.1.p1 GENE.GHVL01017070.1~~GHVL01017070.1.p1  ORF type:complete len:156 (+),score=32.65 GHVL01017070.1:43-510(+)
MYIFFYFFLCFFSILCEKFIIIKANWNKKITKSLKEGVMESLKKNNIKNIINVESPGAYELPMISQLYAHAGADVIIAIGCLIKGETRHFEYISDAVSHGLMKVQLESRVPVIFGVLTVLNEKQAIARSSGEDNHGLMWGDAAVEMFRLKQSLKR